MFRSTRARSFLGIALVVAFLGLVRIVFDGLEHLGPYLLLVLALSVFLRAAARSYAGAVRRNRTCGLLAKLWFGAVGGFLGVVIGAVFADHIFYAVIAFFVFVFI